MPRASDPRDRLLRTAGELFYRQGIHAVGVDQLVREAGVTRATFYRHFPSKDDLVAAYLRATDEAQREAVEATAASGAREDALRAVFGLVAATLTGAEFRGCEFINAAAEYPDPSHPVRRVIAEHRRWFERRLAALAAAAGHPDPEYAAGVLVLLHDGARAAAPLDDPRRVRATLERAVRELL